jgi:hypothetical protein
MADQTAAPVKFPVSNQVTVKVASDTTLDNIKTLVGRIGGIYGCLTCGLLGVDLTLSGEPVEFAEATKLPGVRSVSSGD